MCSSTSSRSSASTLRRNSASRCRQSCCMNTWSAHSVVLAAARGRSPSSRCWMPSGAARRWPDRSRFPGRGRPAAPHDARSLQRANSSRGARSGSGYHRDRLHHIACPKTRSVADPLLQRQITCETYSRRAGERRGCMTEPCARAAGTARQCPAHAAMAILPARSTMPCRLSQLHSSNRSSSLPARAADQRSAIQSGRRPGMVPSGGVAGI